MSDNDNTYTFGFKAGEIGYGEWEKKFYHFIVLHDVENERNSICCYVDILCGDGRLIRFCPLKKQDKLNIVNETGSVTEFGIVPVC